MPAHKGRARRAPYPFDLIIAQIATSSSTTLRVMLGRPDKDGPLIIVTPPATKGQQTQLDYGAQDPEVETSYVWDDFVFGMGQKIESDVFSPIWHRDKRYYYALGVDASIGGQFFPGPALTSGTPGTVDSTNGVTQFYEFGGNLYMVNGRYIQYFTAGNFTVSKDLGVGKVAKHAIVAKQNSSGATTYALIAMGDGTHYWYHDSASATTTWTQHATDDALCWEIKGDEIFRAGDVNGVAKCDLASAFLTAGNWTTLANWRLGDYQYPIQRLKCNAAGTLVVLKQDGLHALDAAGNDQPLYPGVHITPSVTNGLVAEVWENDLFTVYNDVTYKIGPNLELLPVGPERLTENDSGVSGPITQCAGSSFRLYAGVNNKDTGSSYLFGLGAWPRPEDGEPHRIDVWHGSLTAAISSKSITAMYVSSAGSFGAPSGHRLMWLGYSNGTWSSFILPCVPNAKACSSATFNTSGSIAPPLFHGGYPASPKLIRGYTVTGPATHSMTISIVNNDSGGASDQGLSAFATVPAVRQDIHWVATSPTRVLLGQTWTITSGVITGVGVHYQVRNTPQRVAEFSILAADGLLKRDGSRVAQGAVYFQTMARRLREEAGTVYITWPDESSEYCAVTHIEEGVAWSDRTESWHEAIKVRVVTTEPNMLQDVGSVYTL